MSDCNVKTLSQQAKTSAEDLKGKDILALDVKGNATFTDCMIFVTGTSTRHVKSIAQNIIDDVKKLGCSVLSMEGEVDSQWVLVDLGDVIVHVMTQETREHYKLEELWSSANT